MPPNDGAFVFDARPYSAHAWLAAWKYSSKLCWEDMLDEFERDVEAALGDSQDIDATLVNIFQELRKVDMPTDPVFLDTFHEYCGNAIQKAREGNPKPCAAALKRKIDHMVTWLLDISRKQPVA